MLQLHPHPLQTVLAYKCRFFHPARILVQEPCFTATLCMPAHWVGSLTGCSLSVGARATGLPDVNGEYWRLGVHLRIEIRRPLSSRDADS